MRLMTQEIRLPQPSHVCRKFEAAVEESEERLSQAQEELEAARNALEQAQRGGERSR